MKIEVDIQYGCDDKSPKPEQIELWVSAALSERQQATELGVRIVGEVEMTKLNAQYRSKNNLTNVLSFPSDLPKGVHLPLLGDIVICAPVVIREAQAQKKSELSHWAHILVHGTLHLLGYDHIDNAEAEQMEKLETTILQELGFENPYSVESH